MSATHGCNDDKEAVESFKEALIGRVGADRYQMWFAQGVEVSLIDQQARRCASSDVVSSGDAVSENVSSDGEDAKVILVRVRGQFALDRIRNHFLREIRGAASQACGAGIEVQLCLDVPPAEQSELPLEDAGQPPAQRETDDAVAGNGKPNGGHRRRARRGQTKSLSSLIAAGTPAAAARPAKPTASAHQPELPNLATGEASPSAPEKTDSPSQNGATQNAAPRNGMTSANFVRGSCNALAYTAMAMVCQNPGSASPLFISGPTGTGKTHLLSAIAEQLRRFHRMRRVMHLSAEQFTNDFISSVGNSGIASFRRRYRDVDALLIDDVQFLQSKKATLREMLYTVETLAAAGRPLVFSGLQSPMEITGLSSELAGRMAAGLVCAVQPLDAATREVIFRRWLADRCEVAVAEEMIEELTPILAGDGRVISGVVNMINTLQRMFHRAPTMDELRRFGGELLRAAKPLATLSFIETAVCETFHLAPETLRGGSQTRAVTEPRMLAMYLSRQLTSSAYAEIAKHFGGKSHSTAISAEKNVKSWLDNGRPIGRGHAAMSAQEAIDRVESRLRIG